MSRQLRPLLRVGQGWDLHRLVEGGPLRLGGVDIPHDRSSKAHSDGDAVLHVLTDALLGAVGAGDIGQHFSDTDSRWHDADSAVFLEEAVRIARDRGFEIGMVDVTVLLERPKLSPHRAAMIARVSAILDVPAELVSIKAKTNEGLGEIGAGEAVAALAVVGLVAAGQ